MIRLIVSDFDGTLLPYGQSEVSKQTRHLLAQLLEEGRTVALSSGRTYTELATALPDLCDRLYFICCDGAYAVHGGRVLYERRIEPASLEGFLRARKEGTGLLFHGAFQNYALGDLPDSVKREFAPVEIRRLSDLKERIFKVTVLGELTHPDMSYLRMHWDGGPHAVSQYVNRFANKGTALSDLQVRLMLTKYETACLGDSGNDISMMKGAKESYCVGDRCPELKAVCTHQVETATQALQALLT